MSSRIIRGTDGAQADRWSAPAVDGSAAEALNGARGSGAHLLTARQLDELQGQVQEEAYARGFAQGLAEGRSEAAARAAKLAALLDALAAPFDELDERVEAELSHLAVILAAALARREIAHDPDLLATTVRECLAALPVGARGVVVHMSPADAELVESHVERLAEPAWRIESDRALARGDVRVVSATAGIDARLESRLREIAAAAFAAGA